MLVHARLALLVTVRPTTTCRPPRPRGYALSQPQPASVPKATCRLQTAQRTSTTNGGSAGRDWPLLYCHAPRMSVSATWPCGNAPPLPWCAVACRQRREQSGTNGFQERGGGLVPRGGCLQAGVPLARWEGPQDHMHSINEFSSRTNSSFNKFIYKITNIYDAKYVSLD